VYPQAQKNVYNRSRRTAACFLQAAARNQSAAQSRALLIDDFRFAGGDKSRVAAVGPYHNHHPKFIAYNTSIGHGLPSGIDGDAGCAHRQIGPDGSRHRIPWEVEPVRADR